MGSFQTPVFRDSMSQYNPDQWLDVETRVPIYCRKIVPLTYPFLSLDELIEIDEPLAESIQAKASQFEGIRGFGDEIKLDALRTRIYKKAPDLEWRHEDQLIMVVYYNTTTIAHLVFEIRTMRNIYLSWEL